MLKINYRSPISRSVLLLAGTFLGTPAVLADDFVISTPVTVTNGGNAIDGNDSLIITDTGSITVVGANAVQTTNSNNNAIINNGALAATNGNGVVIFENSSVNNTGSISVSGVGFRGIDAANNNTISNSGSIIVTNGQHGIALGDLNTVLNSGSIVTTGNMAHGVNGDGGNNVVNTGTIRALGTNSDGINLRINSTLTNTGMIISAQANAIDLRETGNTLNLGAPSFIGGIINLGTLSTLNITTGSSHSILWDFSTGTMAGGAPNFSGPVPVFYNSTTQQVATYDPTAFQASTDQLADVTGLISNAVRQRLQDDAGPGVSVATADFGVAADDFPAPGILSGPTVWLAALGGYSEYDGTSATLDYDLGQWGLAGGVDWEFAGDSKFGLTAGYLETSLEADSPFANSYDNDANGFFAGLYGRKRFNAHFIDVALTGGGLFHNDERLVNNNLAVAGVSQAEADYNSWWINPEISVGTDFDTAYGWTLTPTARLRYAAQWIDGYTETGAGAGNAVVDSRNIGVGEANLELAARKQVGVHTFTGRLGYLYRTSLGDDSANVTIIGQTAAVPFFDEDRHAGYAGMDANFQLTDRATFGVGAQLAVGDDFFGTQGNARLAIKF